MEINSLKDLQAIENQIRIIIQPYRLEAVLLGLSKFSNRMDAFCASGIASFAIRYCTAGPSSRKTIALSYGKINSLRELVKSFLLADPLSFDETIQQEYVSANPIYTLLRLVGNQMPYRVSVFGRYAQPYILYQEIPQQIAGRTGVPNFDLHAEFQRLNGGELCDFLKVAFVVSSVALRREGFTRAYFDRARSQGLNLPSDETLVIILDQLTADPNRFTKLHRRLQVSDRRFAMYDFNPLFVYPIIRPWRQKRTVAAEQDRMVVPLPNLIAFRVSTGIFYQMFNEHTEVFSTYFGYLFEAYIGRILENSCSSEILLAEFNIRDTYPEKEGKVPDWVIIDGDTAILLECKATRFSRAAVTTGKMTAVNESLKQVMKGLRQVHEFMKACKMKKSGLEQLYRCSNFIPVLVTFEPLYLINTVFFREHINEKLSNDGVVNLPWQILAVDELEKLQPHIASGIRLVELLNELNNKSFYEVLKEVSLKTNRTFKDSFLYETQQELCKMLGFDDAEN